VDDLTHHSNNRVATLDYADRWLGDGLHACGRAGGLEVVEADVTLASKTLQRLKSEGTPATWTHVFVRATAMVLKRNPELHRLVAGNSRLYPSTVDICLSLAGDTCVTPVLIIEDAANKNIRAIAAEIVRRTPEAAKEAHKMFVGLRRFGWLVPFSILRRALLGFLLRRPSIRRKLSGTFQVTCVRQVDLAAPFLFNTAAALGVGRVRDKVVAENGRPVVRPMVTLCCCVDHAQWNGMAAAKFLAELRDIIESGNFDEETRASQMEVMETSSVR
jgi:pyruvate/2-oxoglutarate dehydrogenase complex dihydrolipoamide acyltransferase (E2) component